MFSNQVLTQSYQKHSLPNQHLKILCIYYIIYINNRISFNYTFFQIYRPINRYQCYFNDGKPRRNFRLEKATLCREENARLSTAYIKSWSVIGVNSDAISFSIKYTKCKILDILGFYPVLFVTENRKIKSQLNYARIEK